MKADTDERGRVQDGASSDQAGTVLGVHPGRQAVRCQNFLYDEAMLYGGQLVAPRRKGPTKGLGSRRQAPGRLRSKDLMENTVSDFGRELHKMRDAIERKFRYLSSTGGLLTHLPSWIRTYQRVRAWVQAKLILAELRLAPNRLSTAA